jgi:hypothetical protein
VRDVEGELFAGELCSLQAPVVRDRRWPRFVPALRVGAIAGLVPALGVGAIYFLAHRGADLPWLRIGSILALYGPSVGVLLAVSVELFVHAFDRIARVGYGLVAIANPVTAGGLAGLVAGIAPGAIGVSVFGAYHGPFVGTALIACSVIAGSVMIAVSLARRAGGRGGAAAVAALLATVILCAAALVLAPLIVESAFAEAHGAVAEYGPVVGAVAGATGGAIVGIYIGLVIALARALRRR